MTLRHLRWMVVLLSVLIPLVPRLAAAQDNRRWLADPELIVLQKVVGPNAPGVQTVNTIFDMDLLDRQSGWAAAYSGTLRFDGRWWRPAHDFGSRVGTVTIDMLSPTSGWIGGSQFVSGGPSDVFLARYDGTAWNADFDLVRRDGSTGFILGAVHDIVLRPDGTGWAVGLSYETDQSPAEGYAERPLLLYFDGARWRDQTPAEWRFGRLTNVALAGDQLWATGLLGRPGGSGADEVRPAIVQLRDGAWSEAPLPALPISSQPFSVHGITMRDASEGWAIFTDAGAGCATGRLLHYTGGAWTLVPGEAHDFRAITALGLIPGTNRGWASLQGCRARGQNVPDQRMRFDNGTFTPDPAGAQRVPDRYALLDDETQWAASGGAAVRYSDEQLPTARIPGGAGGARYFVVTGHSLSGRFLAYYESHGLELGDPGFSPRESLALFGYPVSEPFMEVNPDTGEVLEVQYFERARMEYHPDNPDPYKVLLGRLGSLTLLGQGRAYEPPPEAPPGPDCNRYVETGYHLCPPFRAFWEGNGGLPVFGFPITQARDELNPTDGQRYLTQWFERERMEHHPDLRGTPYEVLLGLLAAEELRARGYLP
jgi:hypothetical protein